MQANTFVSRFSAIALQVGVAGGYGLALAVLLLSTTDFNYLSISSVYPFPQDIFMVLLYAIVGLAIVVALNLILRFQQHAERIVLSLIISPALFLSTVLVGQIILLFFFRNITSLALYSLFAFGSLYFAMFAVLLLIVDLLPDWAKQFIVIWYGGSIGSFLGLSIPTLPLVVLFIALVAMDVFTAHTVQPDWAERSKGTDFLGVMFYGAYVGAGDIVCYSAIVAHALAYFGWPMTIVSIIGLVIGIAIVVVAFSKRVEKPIPGLIVVLFGILVWLPFILF